MTVSSALPRVLLCRGALDRAARALVAPGALVDLRHDGFGHGAVEAARVLADAGVTDVIVDPEHVAVVSAHPGLRVHTDGAADVDPVRLFGIPEAGRTAPLEPVMSLHGRVLSTKPLRAGEAVSYGYTHRAAEDTRIALVTGGYAQGIPRVLGNSVRVQIGERMLPIVGRIAMDVCVVDLEGGDVADGAPVVYFGGAGGARDALGQWSTVSGLTALEMAVVIGRHAQGEWSA
ncbi:alanine racemase [Microbacterium sp. NPDC055312]